MSIKNNIIVVVLILSYAITALAKLQQCTVYQQLASYKKVRIEQILTEYQKSVAPIKKQLNATRIALRTQLTQSKLNEQVINELVSKVSSLRNQIFAQHIQAQMQIIKSTGFNPAVCKKPKQARVCTNTTCPVPVTRPYIGPKAGVETAPQQGLHVAPNAGMQTSKPPIVQQPTPPANDKSENSLWE